MWHKRVLAVVVVSLALGVAAAASAGSSSGSRKGRADDVNIFTKRRPPQSQDSLQQLRGSERRRSRRFGYGSAAPLVDRGRREAARGVRTAPLLDEPIED
jgi:hypothetical protein